MPKLIKNAKENILREAKDLILTAGAPNFNMRTVAERSGVAAGTLYNYFPSKEHLIASVILEDWHAILSDARNKLKKVESAIAGCEIIFSAIQGFANMHRAIWQFSLSHTEYADLRPKYHKMLVDQLCDLILPLGERFGFLFDSTVAPFVAEVLLSGGAYPDGKFCFLAPCLNKIVSR